MNDIIVRNTKLEDLNVIQNLNNQLFKLEKENYDSTLVQDWPLSEDGKQYFEDQLINYYVIIAIKDEAIVGYLAGSINEKGHMKKCNMAKLIIFLLIISIEALA